MFYFISQLKQKPYSSKSKGKKKKNTLLIAEITSPFNVVNNGEKQNYITQL